MPTNRRRMRASYHQMIIRSVLQTAAQIRAMRGLKMVRQADSSAGRLSFLVSDTDVGECAPNYNIPGGRGAQWRLLYRISVGHSRGHNQKVANWCDSNLRTWHLNQYLHCLAKRSSDGTKFQSSVANSWMLDRVRPEIGNWIH